MNSSLANNGEVNDWLNVRAHQELCSSMALRGFLYKENHGSIPPRLPLDFLYQMNYKKKKKMISLYHM